MREAKDYCTCTDYQCLCHPRNHDQGCNLCIQKNLKQKEIPSCFFHDINCEKPTTDGITEILRNWLKKRKPKESCEKRCASTPLRSPQIDSQ